jgi:parallel beta-helix repeat protein
MKLTLSLFLTTAALMAQPTLPNAVPMPNPEIQYLDAAGNPLAGGKLCTYAAGTSTPLATYTDSTAGTPNTNPVTLNTAGRASVWVGPALYKFVLRTGGSAYPASDACTTGTIQWTQDNVSDTTLYFANYVKTVGTCTLITFTATGTGAVARTCSSKLSDLISLGDYGAVGDGTADDAVALQKALDAAYAAGPGATVIAPPGLTYASSATLTLRGGTASWGINYKFTGTADGFLVSGNGATIHGGKIDVSASAGTLAVLDPVGNDGFTMEGVTIHGAETDTTSSGLVDLYGANATVTGNTFDNSSVLYLAGNNVRVSGNIWTNYRSGIYAQGGSGGIIEGNRFVSVGGSGYHAGSDSIVTEGVQNYSVIGNLIFNAREHGMYFSGANQHVTVSGNTIYNFSPGRFAGCAGIKVQQETGPTRIANDVTIIGNTVTLNPADAGQAQYGILIVGCDGCTVSGNTTHHLNLGIYVTMANTITIANNVANYNGAAGIYLNDLYGPIVAATITGNETFNNAQALDFAGIEINLNGGFSNSLITASGNQTGDTQSSHTQTRGFLVHAVSGGSTIDNIYLFSNFGIGGTLYTGLTTAPVYIFDQHLTAFAPTDSNPWASGTFQVRARSDQGASRVFDVIYPGATNDTLTYLGSFNAGADVTLGETALNIFAFPSATGANRYIDLEASDGLPGALYRTIRLNGRGGLVQTGAGLAVGSGGTAGYAACYIADGKTLGHCTTAVGSSGACTCTN